MRRLSYIWVIGGSDAAAGAPVPCRTGLRRIGRPDRDSPVLLTCNFRLTVERVRRALAGIDAYLLVANSRGVNVWCAATGGLLTDHDVVSVLKTSGIDELVDHRQVILPQLAATGIEGKTIHRKTGWRVVWGPVEADDIPAFLDRGLETDEAMRTVGFPWRGASRWRSPGLSRSRCSRCCCFPFWPGAVLPLAGLVWGLSLLIFLSFPLYERRLHSTGKNVGFVFFDFGQRGLPLLLWLVVVLGLVGYAALRGRLLDARLRWGLASLVGAADPGPRPHGQHARLQERPARRPPAVASRWTTERCKGAAFCEQVCPKDVFEVDHERRLASLERPEECVQCGACIVQCPFDALRFEGPGGEVLEPEVIRQFKLNLIGSRRVGQPAPTGPSGDEG